MLQKQWKYNCKDCTSDRLCISCQMSKNEVARNRGNLENGMLEIDDEIETRLAERISISNKIPVEITQNFLKLDDVLNEFKKSQG